MGLGLQVYGIRHHGPGSARTLVRALDEQRPNIILIEGPPEANQLIDLAGSAEMKPPVALLVYVTDQPQRSVVYPFANFSPEWQAIHHGLRRNVPIRFIDLSQSVQFAMDLSDGHSVTSDTNFPMDPRTSLAQAGGFETGEQWWEEMIELRRESSSIFETIAEAMTVLREGKEPDTQLEQMREASMRHNIRQAIHEGYEKIAVICGAWHLPALTDLKSSRTADTLLLKGIKKVKTTVTWTPWTYSRLSSSSGYGAGITSPGWYEHLWEHDEGITERWMIKAARLLREHNLDLSPSHAIEAARLAQTLAALRNKHVPDLDEMDDAIQSVFSSGSDLPMRLIHHELTVGASIGTVPSDTPMVPLQADLNRQQAQLRLPMQTIPKSLDLDLRKPGDRDRSQFFHRCELIGLPWAVPERAGNVKGTFHEHWRLQWHADFVMLIIGASPNGNTVEEAATTLAISQADRTNSLSELAGLLERTMFAELPTSLHHVIEKIEHESAVVSDIAQMMDSLPSLVQICRYGNARKTDAAVVNTIVVSLAGRISIGLPSALVSLDDQSAKSMTARIGLVNSSISLLENRDIVDSWFSTITRLADSSLVHGLIAGRCYRILLDAGRIDRENCSNAMLRSLNVHGDHTVAAHWLEGFVEDNGYLLLVDDLLWDVINSWMMSLAEEVFLSVLPLIRRTFSTFSQPERRKVYERVQVLSDPLDRKSSYGRTSYSPEFATAPIPVLSKMLGLRPEVIEGLL